MKEELKKLEAEAKEKDERIKELKEGVSKLLISRNNEENKTIQLKAEAKEKDERIKELEEGLILAIQMINASGFDSLGCDGEGAIQETEDEWSQCQWCDEKESLKKLLNQ